MLNVCITLVCDGLNHIQSCDLAYQPMLDGIGAFEERDNFAAMP